MPDQLYLGCPVWACEQWRGSLFTAGAPRSQWLRQYSMVFNTVEGNSTFYGLPSLESVTRWCDAVPADFRFALKVPRSISHDLRLEDADRALAAFLEIVVRLKERGRLGPSFLQLPPDFGPLRRGPLEAFLQALPTHLPWAVEVRHPGWFEDEQEHWLDELLTDLSIDKVLFDSRALYSKPPDDDIERVAQQRKPKTPVRTTVTGRHPFLRFIGRNRLDGIQPWIDLWAPIIAQWLNQGLEPYVFTHAPDDRYAPEFARRLHIAIAQFRPELPPPSPWLGEDDSDSGERQLLLF